jgi:hypothetical protein
MPVLTTPAWNLVAENETARQEVGISRVGIDGRRGAVGDRVAETRDRAGMRGFDTSTPVRKYHWVRVAVVGNTAAPVWLPSAKYDRSWPAGRTLCSVSGDVEAEVSALM